MHEIGIAQELIETALAEAKKHQGKRILSLYVNLGEGSDIEPESLDLCLNVMAKGTLAEEAQFKINKVSGSAISLERLEIEQD